MTGAISLGGTARRKSSGARSQVCGACQDQRAGRPAPSLGWPGERKAIGATSRGNQTSPGRHLVKGGPGSQGLGAQGLGPGPPGA